MKIVNYNNKLIIKDIDKAELDLDKTFNCGQTFRWNKNNDIWCGIIGNRIITLKQDKNTIFTNLNTNDEDWLISYLNLDMNYLDEMNKIDMEKDEYLKKAYDVSKGIHILRQDLYEIIITFILSQMNSMHNIRNCIEKISQKYGKLVQMTLLDGIEIKSYTFPTPGILANVTSDELRKCKVGFRDKYIIEISKFIYENSHFLEELKEYDYNTAYKILKSFNGIGDKVANCICLFGLHHIEAFPIDTHVKSIINTKYNGNIDLKKYGNIAGIVQQYMFYYKAF